MNRNRNRPRWTCAPLVALLLVLLGTSPLLGAEDLPFDMPTPEGWRTETIPFPLGFAPELDYEGLEELRFAPGMFEAGSPQFWTYAFLWWLPSGTALEADQLEEDLVAYYRGLSSNVTESEDFQGEARFTASLKPIEPDSQGRKRWVGQLETLDSFVTREQVTLRLLLTVWDCPGHRVAFFELSPQPDDHEVWTQLAGIRDGFACSR